MSDLATRSYWLGLDAYTANPLLGGDTEVDVAIVGGGFTGLWTAYLLLAEEPDLRVAVFEANAVGYGASGRNGGFCMTKVHNSLSDLAEVVGDDEARKIHCAATRAVDSVADITEREGIACDLERNGLLMVSTNAVQDRKVERELETIARLGLEDDYTAFDRVQAQDRLHSERVRLGYREHHGSVLNPARLVRGLKTAVERLGGTVYEGTAVAEWEEHTGGVVLRTPHGSVRADRAVVGGNAYGTRWAPTRRRVLPFYTYISLTRPLTDKEWGRVGWKGREGVEDFRVSIHYFRPTSDGRILWGGRDALFQPDGPNAEYDSDASCFRRLRESFEWFFPQLTDVPFEHEWGGPIALTGHSIPGVGWLDRSSRKVAFAHGYNGHGVGITHVAARALVDLFAGRESEWTNLWFVGRPPPDNGPPGFVRDAIVRMTVRAAIRADEEGRELRTPLAIRLMNWLAQRPERGGEKERDGRRREDGIPGGSSVRDRKQGGSQAGSRSGQPADDPALVRRDGRS
jgi:glycine/D-amino acid oxidase-like deaminating enzyme